MHTYPYWWEAFKPYHYQNCSPENKTYDLVIIGAGYTGVSAAKEASSKNLKTLLIDQFALGEGASTRSAGMVSGGLNLGKKINLFKEYGNQIAREFVNESIESYRYLEDQINGHYEDVAYQKTGRLVLAHSNKALNSLKHKADLLNSFTKLNIDYLTDIQKEIPSSYYKGGILVNDAASIHPSLFYHFLLKQTLENNVDVFSPCKLISYKQNNNFYEISTSEGSVTSKYLLFATNGYSDQKIGKENYNIIGVPSYIAVTEEIGYEKIIKLMPKLRMYSDTKNDLFYFRPTPDHKRLLFGGFPIWANNKEDSPYVKRFFYKNIQKILPEIGNKTIDYIWGGKVGVTFNTLPQVSITKNKIYVFGCNGSGVALMPFLGNKAISLISSKPNKEMTIMKIKNKKNYFKFIISSLLPLLGIYFRLKEKIQNKFF